MKKVNCLESDSLKAITRISGYEEDIIGCNSKNIAELERQVEERTVQLQQRNKELQEINRIKAVLLHTVSHEIFAHRLWEH